MRVKICGMRRRQDIEYVNAHHPDYAGFILSGGFRRSIELGTFCELDSYLDREIKRVGVFVNEPIENVLKYYAEMLDVIQLHGDEDRQYIKTLRESFSGEIWKAVRAGSSADIEAADKLPCDMLLIDSFSAKSVGGTGETADTDIILGADFTKPYFIAGGISESNVQDILDRLRSHLPVGVDLSSSVETDGVKDEKKIGRFMQIVDQIII